MFEIADLRKAAWDATTTAILVVSGDGTIRLVNDALERQLGYARPDLIGKKVETLIPAGVRGEHERLRARYQESPVARPMGRGLDLRAVRPAGTLY